MSETQDQAGRLTRRRALKKIAETAGAGLAFPVLGNAALSNAPLHTAAATPYVPKFFNASQMEMIASLAELIVPADDHSPGARAARVHEYIDTILVESSITRKDAWVKGLATIHQMALLEFEKQFAQCDSNQLAELLQKISVNEGHPATPAEHFFTTIKNATIQGYYTSSIGIHQELEYQGNTALEEFEGCTHMPPKIEDK
jgi:glucoside 3-dehydrogenase (cytochrome c) hitch-hiker subunit